MDQFWNEARTLVEEQIKARFLDRRAENILFVLSIFTEGVQLPVRVVCEE